MAIRSSETEQKVLSPSPMEMTGASFAPVMVMVIS